ncbi:MAG: phosphatidylglycerophosphatase A [Rhodospirillaceae bacterium]|nr:phosphatidylglycerophosphatase A [Rhodospirillaceae bacterium]
MILTWFGCGRSPFAPGTVGSLGALPFGWTLQNLGGSTLLIAAAAILFFCGWACANAELAGNDTDPGWIVIDEVVGQWIALAVVPMSLLWYGAAFALFRVFDILKPWPVNWADRNVGGGLGVMLDDVLAGVYAAGVLVILRWLLN